MGEFFMDLEEILRVKIPGKAQQKLRTFRQVVEYIETKKSKMKNT